MLLKGFPKFLLYYPTVVTLLCSKIIKVSYFTSLNNVHVGNEAVSFLKKEVAGVFLSVGHF